MSTSPIMGADPLSMQALRGACLEREAGGAEREAGAIDGGAPGSAPGSAPGVERQGSRRGPGVIDDGGGVIDDDPKREKARGAEG
jgi:hypothetical protein